jgi:hypothetical protein
MAERDMLGEVRYEIMTAAKGEEVKEEEAEEEEQPGVDGITEQVLRRPDVLAALQGRLHAEMLEVMPLLILVKAVVS